MLRDLLRQRKPELRPTTPACGMPARGDLRDLLPACCDHRHCLYPRIVNRHLPAPPSEATVPREQSVWPGCCSPPEERLIRNAQPVEWMAPALLQCPGWAEKRPGRCLLSGLRNPASCLRGHCRTRSPAYGSLPQPRPAESSHCEQLICLVIFSFRAGHVMSRPGNNSPNPPPPGFFPSSCRRRVNHLATGGHVAQCGCGDRRHGRLRCSPSGPAWSEGGSCSVPERSKGPAGEAITEAGNRHSALSGHRGCPARPAASQAGESSAPPRRRHNRCEPIGPPAAELPAGFAAAGNRVRCP